MDYPDEDDIGSEAGNDDSASEWESQCDTESQDANGEMTSADDDGQHDSGTSEHKFVSFYKRSRNESHNETIFTREKKRLKGSDVVGFNITETPNNEHDENDVNPQEGDEDEMQNWNDEDDDEDQEDSDEESNDEVKIGIGASLAARASRGTRMNTMIGESIQKDEEFWSHNTWEEEEDGDYNCSEGEAMYEDIVDSDFDKKASEEEESDQEVVEKKRKKKSVYVDPSKKSKTLVRRAKVKSESTEITASSRSKRASTIAKTEAVSTIFTKKKTKRKTKTYDEQSSDEEKWKVSCQCTHLGIAKTTEKLNATSLRSLQAWEEGKKITAELKRSGAYRGHFEIYISWASDRAIQYDDEEVTAAKNTELSSDQFNLSTQGQKTDSIVKREQCENLGGGPQGGGLIDENINDSLPKLADRGRQSLKDFPKYSEDALLEKSQSNKGTILKIPQKDCHISNKTHNYHGSCLIQDITENSSKQDATVPTECPQDESIFHDDDVVAEQVLMFTDGKIPEMYTKTVNVSKRYYSTKDLDYHAFSLERANDLALQRDLKKNSFRKLDLEYSTDESMEQADFPSPETGSDDTTNRPLCVVYGVTAKYKDPFTRLYYSNKESFKIIRQHYFNLIDKQVEEQMNSVGDLLKQKLIETKSLMSSIRLHSVDEAVGAER